MRKFIPSIILIVIVIIWQFLIQFTFIDSVITKLRLKGQGGAFVADMLVSQKAVWALIIVAILLTLQGIREARAHAKLNPGAAINLLEEKQWYETPEYDLGLVPRKQAQQVAAQTGVEPFPKVEPNIVCDEFDQFVKFEDGYFQSSDTFYSDSPRVLGAAITNEPKPPERIGSLEDVEAQVIFYDLRVPEWESHKVRRAHWLDYKYPSVTIPPNSTRNVIFGIIDCSNISFTIYENNREEGRKTLPTTPQMHMNCQGFAIKVRLIAGKHREWSKEFDFVLRDIGKTGFHFRYVSDDFKKDAVNVLRLHIATLLIEGETFVTMPLINVAWEKLYQDIHSWRNKVWKALEEYSPALLQQFTSPSVRHEYPHKIPDGNKQFFDETYTQVENLKEIGRAHGMPIPASNVYKEKQEVSEKRRKKITDDLRVFAERLAMIREHPNTMRSSQDERALHILDAEIHSYLLSYLNKEDAALILSSNLEDYVPLHGVAESELVRRVTSRLLRLNSLLDDIESGRRVV